MIGLSSPREFDILKEILVNHKEIEFLINILREKTLSQNQTDQFSSNNYRTWPVNYIVNLLAYLTRRSKDTSGVRDIVDGLIKFEILGSDTPDTVYLLPESEENWKKLTGQQIRIMNEKEISIKPLINTKKIKETLRHVILKKLRQVWTNNNDNDNLYGEIIEPLVRNIRIAYCNALQVKCSDENFVTEINILNVNDEEPNEIYVLAKIIFKREEIIGKCPYLITKLIALEENQSPTHPPCKLFCERGLFLIVYNINKVLYDYFLANPINVSLDFMNFNSRCFNNISPKLDISFNLIMRIKKRN